MNKRYFVAASITVVLLLVVCCFLAGQYVTNGCFWWECAPDRSFHVRDWEIPISLFPEGAFTDHITPPTDNMVGEIEGGGQDIYIGYSPAVYQIFRFPSTGKAIADFNRIKKGMFDPQTDIAWNPPDTLTFSSATADDLYIACGYFHQYRCEMVARYQEYNIFFGAFISDSMTYADFEKVIIYLDEQISNRLYP